MRVYHGFCAARGLLPRCAVALGNFDGVHVGHQALFAAARRLGAQLGGPSVVATFEPHPGKVLSAQLAPKLLTPLDRKLELLAALELDAAVVQPFDLAYAGLSANDFLDRELFGCLDPSAVVVGHDFTFGRGRSGTIATLAEACRARGAVLEEVAPVAVGGVVVSSTKVREFLAEGRVEAASQLLGRPFDICGTIVSGHGRGRTIGFPTANLEPDNEVQPGIGVYAVRVWALGRVWGGAANIGRKPTFGDQQVTIEIHLFDFSGDLYGTRLCVEFLERLRGEQRFSGPEELREQIKRDCERARQVIQAAGEPAPLSPHR